MFITVGEIIKAQGIVGELKVKPLTSDILRFFKLKKVYIEGEMYRISAVRIADDFVYIKLDGISDRNKAEALIKNLIEIDREDAIKLPEGSYFISDIIGCDVSFADKTLIGKVSYVYQNGAADVFEVKGEKEVMFPFLNKLVVSIDVANKEIIVDKTEFDKVAVYED